MSEDTPEFQPEVAPMVFPGTCPVAHSVLNSTHPKTLLESRGSDAVIFSTSLYPTDKDHTDPDRHPNSTLHAQRT